MLYLWSVLLALTWIAIAAGLWLGWQLLRQNGRMLLRLEEIENRLNEYELAETERPSGSDAGRAEPNGEQERANRFGKRSLAHSKIKRDGLKAGTPAPDFRLPCLEERDLSLQDFRGRRVLLVFSDPHCGPCNALAPQLEQFHRKQTDISVVMISRGEPKENRSKIKQHGLTFPVLLQQRWEISRRYAMFATPMAYLIDESGIITHNVALGIEAILALTTTSQNAASPQPKVDCSLRTARSPESPGIGCSRKV